MTESRLCCRCRCELRELYNEHCDYTTTYILWCPQCGTVLEHWIYLPFLNSDKEKSEDIWHIPEEAV